MPKKEGDEEILGKIQKNKPMVDAICITGGEPTMQRDLVDFIRKVKNLGFLVKLDTNGSNPDKIQTLIDEGLVDYFAMDIKAPWEKYALISPALNPKIVEECKKTLAIIQDSGVPHEFRTTVFPGAHEDTDFFEMAGYLKEGEVYYIQEISYFRNLDHSIPHDNTYDVCDVVHDLRLRFPALSINTR